MLQITAGAGAGGSTARGAGGINCPGGGAENGVVMESMQIFNKR